MFSGMVRLSVFATTLAELLRESFWIEQFAVAC